MIIYAIKAAYEAPFAYFINKDDAKKATETNDAYLSCEVIEIEVAEQSTPNLAANAD